ncbi:hypothetical protein ACJJIQ_14225 [Microbulbifer sp. ANSA003]|uniref:hypothetical protein n=1 Tax=Microbulbifer sp. ANSA003 TaxID=3243360 RepID=UPI0040430DAC
MKKYNVVRKLFIALITVLAPTLAYSGTEDQATNPDPELSSSSQVTRKIEGEFSVDPSGNSNYTIPLFVPKGTANHQPSIHISYSTGSGIDLVGYGMDIGEVSSIVPRQHLPDILA